jgi:hypothetical protein
VTASAAATLGFADLVIAGIAVMTIWLTFKGELLPAPVHADTPLTERGRHSARATPS